MDGNIIVVPCKRTQHVGSNNVACRWPTMLRLFAWAFLKIRTLAINVGLGIVRYSKTKYLKISRSDVKLVWLRMMRIRI